MSEQDIIELITHPRFALYVQRVAMHEARKILLAHPDAPNGYTTYERAASALGFRQQTVRAYRSHGLLKGKDGYVCIESVLLYAQRRNIPLQFQTNPNLTP